MCGLFGMMGNGITYKDIEMMRDLAYVTGLRGMDGAGLMQGKSDKWNKKVKWDKTQRDINYFLTYHKYHKDGDISFLNTVSCNFFAGHCRWKTKGAQSNENSHPFDVGGYIGMHNGTLVEKRYEHATKTDSEMMFHDMEARGIQDVLHSLSAASAYAIVVFNKETGDLVFARNAHRKLFFAYNKHRAVTYWSSEKEMLHLCAVRNDITLGEFAILNPNVIYTVSPDSARTGAWPKWYTCDVDEGKKKAVGFIPPQKQTPVMVSSTGATGDSFKIPSNTNTSTAIPPVNLISPLSKAERKAQRKREADEKKRQQRAKTVTFEEGGVRVEEQIELNRAKSPDELIKEAQAMRAIEQGNANFMEEFNRVHGGRFQNPSWSEMVEGADGEWEPLHEDDGLDYDKDGNVLDNGHTYPPRVSTVSTPPVGDLKFNPRKIDPQKCDWCDANLSLVDAYYARRTSGGTIMCSDCEKEFKDEDLKEVSVH